MDIKIKDDNEVIEYVSISSKRNKNLFGKVKDDDIHYSKIGERLNEFMKEYFNRHKEIRIDRYIILPNKVHILFRIDKTLEVFLEPMIKHFKNEFTQNIKENIWEENYRNRIIDDYLEYILLKIYLMQSPAKWYKVNCK